MEREDLIRHLAGWRDGVDPATGALLPPDHPAQRPDFLRVVCAASTAFANSGVSLPCMSIERKIVCLRSANWRCFTTRS